MFEKIWTYQSATVNDNTEYKNKDGNLIDHITIKKINIIIGQNNSGKSRFLRRIFISNKDEFLITPTWSGKNVDKLFSEIINEFKNLVRENVLPKENKNFINQIELIENIQKKPIDTIDKWNDRIDKMEHVQNFIIQALRAIKAPEEKIKTLDEAVDKIRSIDLSKEKISFPNRYYIPILRSLRPIDAARDTLKERTTQDYFKEKKPEKNQIIITGFELYRTALEKLLGKPDGRKKIQAYQEIISENLFNKQEFTIIPEIGSDTVSVKIGADAQHAIYNLGDGLQQAIIITTFSFLEEKESIFFIEEPENFMHPRLLREVIIFLLENTPHQFFITSHSNHLLDLAEQRDDVLIHKISRTKSDESSPPTITIHECSKNKDILMELGVHPSSVYLANATIWVEGITDRFYIREFMRKFMKSDIEQNNPSFKNYKENFHYTFIEYQGSALTHWDFESEDTEKLSALCACAEAFLIADGDIKDKKGRDQKLKAQLGDRSFILPGKEIENLLSTEVLRETAKRLFDRKENREHLDKTKLEIVNFDDYKNSDNGIGRYLDDLLEVSNESHSKGFFATSSGTIKDKLKFCHEAIRVMEEIYWKLPKEAEDLCEKIFAHIKNCNP